MKHRIRAYLELIRFPNLFTAMADVLAGYLIVRATAMNWVDLGFLLLATSCIYGGGCALNDLHDRHLDARERPRRPIPSGRVSVPEAMILTILLFAGGFLAAYRTGAGAAVIVLLLILAVIVYDVILKEREVAGPMNMATCRSLNLMLGMSPGLTLMALSSIFPVITLVYLFSLTTLSHFEVEGGLGARGGTAFGGLAICLIGIVLLIIGRYLNPGALIFLICLLVFSGPPLVAAGFRPAPQRVGRAVKFLVLGIPLLDAVYVAGIHGWAYGIPVALCIVPAVFLARIFYVT